MTRIKKEVNIMKKEMEEMIKEQLAYNGGMLYCLHNSERACEECMKKITGYVSGITGNVSGITGNVSWIRGYVSGITGNVSGITGYVSEITGNVSEITGNVSWIR